MMTMTKTMMMTALQDCVTAAHKISLWLCCGCCGGCGFAVVVAVVVAVVTLVAVAVVAAVVVVVVCRNLSRSRRRSRTRSRTTMTSYGRSIRTSPPSGILRRCRPPPPHGPLYALSALLPSAPISLLYDLSTILPCLFASPISPYIIISLYLYAFTALPLPSTETAAARRG